MNGTEYWSTAMSEDLIAFFTARLDEEEASARSLLVSAQHASLSLQDPALLGRSIPGWYSWPDVEAMCLLRLRDVEAKRAILAAYERAPDWPGGEDVRYLAAIWNDHRDYRDEWASDA